jgi:hypothetical protein
MYRLVELCKFCVGMRRLLDIGMRHEAGIACSAAGIAVLVQSKRHEAGIACSADGIAVLVQSKPIFRGISF